MRGPWRTRGRAHVFGHDIEHDGALMPRRLVAARATDPAELIPHLLEELRPSFREQVREGDFVIAGRNFGCGHLHNQAFIAMEALGLRVLCESMPGAVIRATVALALPVLHRCTDITSWVHDGDVLDVCCATGEILNHTTGEKRHVPPVADGVRVMLEQGGMKGLLARHLAEHPELGMPLGAGGGESKL